MISRVVVVFAAAVAFGFWLQSTYVFLDPAPGTPARDSEVVAVNR